VILAELTIKFNLINYVRSVIFSTAPSFVALAAVKAGYEILASEDGERVRAFLIYQKNLGRLTQSAPSGPTRKHPVLSQNLPQSS
jgi:8-amino-7-oxononanoate synthase